MARVPLETVDASPLRVLLVESIHTRHRLDSVIVVPADVQLQLPATANTVCRPYTTMLIRDHSDSATSMLCYHNAVSLKETSALTLFRQSETLPGWSQVLLTPWLATSSSDTEDQQCALHSMNGSSGSS